MKYIFVPPSILKVLRDNGFEGRDYIDVNKLLSILSPEDLSFYLYVNLCPVSVLPAPVSESFGNALIYGGVTTYENKLAATAVTNAPWETIEDKHIAKIVSKCVNDYCVEETKPVFANSQLCSEVLWLTGGQIIMFTMKTVGENKTLNGVEYADSVKSFYRDLLGQLLMFCKFEEVAALPAFAGYLDASRAKLDKLMN